jgi:hypothetical protein
VSLAVVCFKWAPPAGYRSTFGPETVNILRAMVRRHYAHPHTFTCITDDPTGIDSDIRILPLWNDYADVPSPHGGRNPSCYRRLKLFSREAADLIGPRLVSIDLDTVIVGDVAPLWNRSDDLVMWGDTNPLPGSHYNGSMILHTPGTRTQVWETFHPKTSPMMAKSARCFGSDQGWISYCLGKGEARWTTADGVYSFRNHLHEYGSVLPANARVTFWHGHHDPWGPVGQSIPWVREHYRRDPVAA